jgi:hypothetical protein
MNPDAIFKHFGAAGGNALGTIGVDFTLDGSTHF